MNFIIKIKFGFNLERKDLFMLTKIGTKLNKNHEYMHQIEYKTLNLTHGMLPDSHVDI